VPGDPAHETLVECGAAYRVVLQQQGIREGAHLDHLLRGIGRPDPGRGAAEELGGGVHDGPEDLVEVERRRHHLVDPVQGPQPLLAQARRPEQARILDGRRRVVRELAEHAQIRVGPDAPGPGGDPQDAGDLPAEAQWQHGLAAHPLRHDVLGELLRHARVGEVVLGDERLAGREHAAADTQPRLQPQAHPVGRAGAGNGGDDGCLAAGFQRRDERVVGAGQLAGAVGDALEHHRVVQRRGELVPDRFERLGLVQAAVGRRTQSADGHRGLVRNAATERGLGLAERRSVAAPNQQCADRLPGTDNRNCDPRDEGFEEWIRRPGPGCLDLD
jgi:hypothetical protein